VKGRKRPGVGLSGGHPGVGLAKSALVACGLAGCVVAAFLAYTVIDDESGLRSWLHLRGELGDARARIAVLEQEVAGLGTQSEQLMAGEAALEAAIREELELARPGQTLVRFRSEASSPRFP
jgi:cell division protein FtsB